MTEDFEEDMMEQDDLKAAKAIGRCLILASIPWIIVAIVWLVK